MNLYQKHYYDVVQRDMILSENVPSVFKLPGLQKVVLCVVKNNPDENEVVSLLTGLKIIVGCKPYVIRKKAIEYKSSSNRGPVGVGLTLRRTVMSNFLYRFSLKVLTSSGRFQGLTAPKHNSQYTFVLRDMFSFRELIPLLPFIEDLGSLQCEFHFTTRTRGEMIVMANGLQLPLCP
uniref:ribosomal protein L5 n=1 Tax=Scytothamnus australis TaxID=66621 RepID=UPI002E764422|nr:ribosomal protein L5 [Scytothamnus australis]WBP70298.1 ribosomal protein L5 [Scytothamnus australis]